MIEVGEFKALSTDEAAENLSVVLRKRGIHRNADISLQVAPPVTDEEIQALQDAGHIDEGDQITQYDRATDFKIDEADELSPEHQDTALAIAEKLARWREMDSARVSVMGTYTFGDFSEYTRSTIVLLRQ